MEKFLDSNELTDHLPAWQASEGEGKRTERRACEARHDETRSF